jgi:hypothetical protein
METDRYKALYRRVEISLKFEKDVFYVLIAKN